MIAFTADRKQRFDNLVKKYEIKASALLPALHLAQDQWGHLTEENMNYVAGLLELPPRHVYEVASFYVLLRKKDWGKYCLQVCQNITCCMMGSDDLVKVIQEELGLKPNQVSEDKSFSFMPVQCLGSCDTGPVVQINEDYFENLTPEILRGIIKRLRAGDRVKPGRQSEATA